MLEPELPGEHLLELETSRVAVVSAGDENVCGQSWEAGRDRPDVEVVHLDDALGRGHSPADLACVDPGRSRFQQDHDRVAQDAPRAREDEERDRHPRKRIRLLPACREHDDRGDRHAGGRGEVGQDVPERGLHVEALPGRPREDPRRNQVDGEPEQCDGEHPAAEDLRRVVETPDRLDEDPDRDRDEHETVHERGEDLGALKAEAAVGRGGTRGEPGRTECKAQRPDVSEHVAGVGEQREAARQQPGDDLHDRVRGREAEHEREGPSATRPAVLVRVGHLGGLIVTPSSKSA